MLQLLISIYFNGGSVSSIPNFDDPNAFSQVQQAPGPYFRMVGKSLVVIVLSRKQANLL